MTAPLLSVIVPAHNAAALLPLSLGAILGNDLPRKRWELIIVDDASTDGTGEVAAPFADRLVSLTGSPHGPGYARNRGVEVTRGEWVVFIDADVVVHADTLRRFAEDIEADPEINAVFGAYDDNPVAPGFLSQYRNLLHRYVHLSEAGPAESFWAGCGAVRRSAFVAVGGFDEQRYRRPQIEDIELGYRLRDHGGSILLDPGIQGAHLKHWRFSGSVRTDVLDRGIPWVRLLLERRRMATLTHLNVKRGERTKTVLVGLALLLLFAGLVTQTRASAEAGVVVLLVIVLWNLPLFAWFARRRGELFALAVIPMNLWYYVMSGVSVVAGVVLHLLEGGPQTEAPVASTTGFGPVGDRARTRRSRAP